ncbi:MAG: FAD-dependent oxidoreductase, partial [Clostridia bacterium]|nr:FAD-dependent oxidoreductase [Clostridia bacterium]
MRRQAERFQEAQYELIVVGGGMSGLCAALASARHGVKTALVNSRPVLGGNASSEIRIHISGADQGMKQADYAEGGILYELMLENKSRNESFNYSIWDMILFEAASKQENLTVYHNTVMYDCEMEGDRITAIDCVQETTEMRLRLSAPLFVDATGNGTLGYYAGAEYRIGSEPKSEFNEPHAPEEANNDRMGNTIMMKAVNLGHPVHFQTPAFAKHLTEKQLAKRIHCAEMRDHIDVSDSPNPEEYKRTSMTSSAASDYGYWWCELMGTGKDIIPEFETIRDDLMAYAYGIWDHIKNNDEHVHNHHAENLELEWVGALPGMRESRRMVGDYLINENDVLGHRIFDDAICYGGWCVDMHAPHGLLD